MSGTVRPTDLCVFSALFFRSLLLSELHKLLVHPGSPGHMVLGQDAERISIMYSHGCPLPDKLASVPILMSDVTSRSPQPRVTYILKKNVCAEVQLSYFSAPPYPLWATLK